MGCEARLACPPSRRRIAQPALTIKCVGANVLAPIALTIKFVCCHPQDMSRAPHSTRLTGPHTRDKQKIAWRPDA